MIHYTHFQLYPMDIY